MARIQTTHRQSGDLFSATMYNEIIDSVNALYDRQESFKGAYASPDDLGRVKGSDGDLALVLDDGAFPAAIYRHNGTAWAATGKTWSPTESIDLAAYAKSIDLALLVCGTAAATAAKVVTAAGYALKNGGNIRIKMTYANTADNATLNINSTGNVPLYYDGERASSTNSWEAGETILVYYDVTTECFMACNAQGGSGKFSTGEKVRNVGIDSVPTADSVNLMTSGGVFQALNTETQIDLSAFPTRNCSLGEPNWYMNGSAGRHKAIPVNAGDIIKLSPVIPSGISSSFYGWLTSSYDPSVSYTSGSPVPYVSGTSRVRFYRDDGDFFIKAPEGAAYLCLTIVDGGGNTTSYTLSQTLDKYSFLKNKISALRDEIEGIKSDELLVYKTVSMDLLNGNGDTIVMQNHVTVKPSTEYVVRVTPRTWIIPDQTSTKAAFGIYEYNATSSASIKTPILIPQNEFTGLAEQYIVVTTSNTTRMRVQFRAPVNVQLKIEFLERVPNSDIEKAIGELVGGTDFANTVSYAGNRINLDNAFKWKQFGNNVLYGKFNSHGSQSVAIYDGYLLQLFDTGDVVVFSIDEDDLLTELGNFRLACANVSPSIHCNAAQFAPSKVSDQPFPYLYVADGLNKRVFVEQINVSGSAYSSTTMQTVSHDDSAPFDKGLCSNFIIGDDGYLWIEFADAATQRFMFYKMNCPAVSAGDITLTSNDVLQTIIGGAMSSQYTLQSMCVIGGKLFNSFGASGGKHRVDVFDTNTGNLINAIPLDDIMTGECEGIYIYNGKMYITMYNLRYGYVLKFV